MNKQDIITSIKNLDIFLKVPELKGAKAKLNKNGSPYAFAGGFNMVFQLHHKRKKWAFRVWHIQNDKYKERYRSISKYLESTNLPYFAKFIYDENGILVNGNLLDTIRMEWVEGLLLKEYIEKNLKNKKTLEDLANNFLLMTEDLRSNNISHGDLQEGNIIVTQKGKIKLVDYDSICIPELEGELELVTGLKGYQHPSRFLGGETSMKADYFSELVIYISILALAENSILWEVFEVKETQYMLFSENDFEDFENSKIYSELSVMSSEIVTLLSILLDFLKIDHFNKLRPFTTYLLPPVIRFFKPNKEVLIEGIEINIEWEVENVQKVSINNGIGEVAYSGNLEINPKSTDEYILTATGFKSTITEKLDIKIFPTPLISSIRVPIPEFEKITNLNIAIPTIPIIDLAINNINSNLIIQQHEMIPQVNFNNEGIHYNKLDDKSFLNKKNRITIAIMEVKNSAIRLFDKLFQNRINEKS